MHSAAIEPWRCKACYYPLGDIHAGPSLLINGREVLGVIMLCPKCGRRCRWVPNDKPSETGQSIDKGVTGTVQCVT